MQARWRCPRQSSRSPPAKYLPCRSEAAWPLRCGLEPALGGAHASHRSWHCSGSPNCAAVRPPFARCRRRPLAADHEHAHVNLQQPSGWFWAEQLSGRRNDKLRAVHHPSLHLHAQLFFDSSQLLSKSSWGICSRHSFNQSCSVQHPSTCDPAVDFSHASRIQASPPRPTFATTWRHTCTVAAHLVGVGEEAADGSRQIKDRSHRRLLRKNRA